MKLKNIAITIGVSALASAPVLASANTSKPMHRRHHSKKMVRHMSKANAQDQITALRSRVGQMQAMLYKLAQNENRKVGTPTWFRRLRLSGGIAADVAFGNLSAAGSTVGMNNSTVSLNNVYLNVDAIVNRWTTARIGFNYYTASANYNPFAGGGFAPALTSTAGMGSKNFNGRYGANGVRIDQAYITFANFARAPYFLRVGEQYLPFGEYQLHPMTRSFTQVLTEGNAVAAQLGFSDASGMFGSIYILENPMLATNRAQTPPVTSKRKAMNFGVTLGYGKVNKNLGYHVKLDYLNSMASVFAVKFAHDAAVAAGAVAGTYANRVDGMAVSADINSGPFDGSARYVTALQHFNDIFYKVNTAGIAQKAQPSAFDFQAGYTFHYWHRAHRVYVGWGHSYQASAFGLPINRFTVGMTSHILRNTTVGLEWAHDHNYGATNLGLSTGNVNNASYNVVMGRLAVNFG